jgi:proline iminopeptidase
MHTLFPEIKPFKEQFLAVSSIHTLCVAQYGNSSGIPVVILHGGPGGARSPRLTQFFDPKHYHMITFDQRGCGLSTPYGELRENNADALIDDIDAVREFIGVDQWLICGGSWGAQLGLRYAFRYTDHITGFILRSPFLGRRQDLQWRFSPNGGAAQIFPDHYADFCQRLNNIQLDDPIQSYCDCLERGSEFEQLAAAQQWSIWKGSLSHLVPPKVAKERFGLGKQSMALARIESYYYSHHCFMADNHIIDNLNKIEHLTGILVHGRYDMVCKLEGSQLIAQHWPNCHLQIVPGAGHSSSEIGIIDALIQGTNTMADWLRTRV